MGRDFFAALACLVFAIALFVGCTGSQWQEGAPREKLLSMLGNNSFPDSYAVHYYKFWSRHESECNWYSFVVANGSETPDSMTFFYSGPQLSTRYCYRSFPGNACGCEGIGWDGSYSNFSCDWIGNGTFNFEAGFGRKPDMREVVALALAAAAGSSEVNASGDCFKGYALNKTSDVANRYTVCFSNGSLSNYTWTSVPAHYYGGADYYWERVPMQGLAIARKSLQGDATGGSICE